MLRVGLVLVFALPFQAGPGDANQVLAAGKAAAAKPPQVKTPAVHNPKVTAVSKDLEIQTIDDLIVRRMQPPDQYDEKGTVRKPTQAELKELKGPDPKLPGYKADVNDLKNGQIVTVSLQKRKDTDKKDADKKDDDKKDAGKKTSDKDGWVNAGTLSGTLTKYQDSLKTMTLRVNVADLAGRHHRTGKGNKITLDDFRVSMVVIQSKDKPPATK
jgi:hypothetical protein